jgi:hypothetical protein
MSEFLTRHEVCALLRQHGIPIGMSTLEKIGAQSCDPALLARYRGGPPIAGFVPGRGRSGRRPLYEPAAVLAWGKSLLRPSAPDQDAA